jgi:hypothetical protein
MRLGAARSLKAAPQILVYICKWVPVLSYHQESRGFAGIMVEEENLMRRSGNVQRRGNALVFTMTKKLLFVTTLLLVVALAAFAADVTGKWTFEQAGRGGGGTPTVVTLNLKSAGAALTGTMSRPGRDGAAMESPISDGKIDGDNISFTTSQTMGDMTMKTEYKGTVAGSEIKLKVTRAGRDGTPTTTEVTAKKATT